MVLYKLDIKLDRQALSTAWQTRLTLRELDTWSTVEIRFLWVQQKKWLHFTVSPRVTVSTLPFSSSCSPTCPWAQVFKALEIRQAIQGTWLRNWHIPHKQFSALLLQCTLNYALADHSEGHSEIPSCSHLTRILFVLVLPFYGFSFNYILGHACWLTQIFFLHLLL